MKITEFYQTIDTTATPDTLTESYGQEWEAMSQLDQAGPLMQFMASNDLIFVVLGVSLIIWLVLLAFLIRLDRKVGRLERQVDAAETTESTDETTNH